MEPDEESRTKGRPDEKTEEEVHIRSRPGTGGTSNAQVAIRRKTIVWIAMLDQNLTQLGEKHRWLNQEPAEPDRSRGGTKRAKMATIHSGCK